METDVHGMGWGRCTHDRLGEGKFTQDGVWVEYTIICWVRGTKDRMATDVQIMLNGQRMFKEWWGKGKPKRFEAGA